jgi:23S rRNA (pseudouridine1915-N3)-methyltransferase
MKLSVFAVGRMKAGPEQALADRYFERLSRVGGAVGLDFTGVAEIAESRARAEAERRREEGARLETFLAEGGALILLDERGRNMTSPDLAAMLAGLRDAGERSAAVAIGGPDGHDPSLRGRARLVLSFGALTWPHQLVRVMLGEQLYRAATILSGHPYHRA